MASVLEQSSDAPLLASRSSGDGQSSVNEFSPAGAAASSFGCDVLSIYATCFREARGGVDWVVVAEALGASSSPSFSSGRREGTSSSPACARALLRWVSRADGPDTAAANSASALRSNALPYAERALARHPGDSGLAIAVAALEVATGRLGCAQRVLEAALRLQPHCSALWEQRIAMEAAFGAGSQKRASATSLAAASKGVMLRLRFISCCQSLALVVPLSMSPEQTPSFPSTLQTRVASRILAIVSNPLSRRETMSLCLKGALLAVPDKAAATTTAKGKATRARQEGDGEGHLQVPSLVDVPQSIFLLTNLVSLSLARNGLMIVPSAVGRLLSLRSLDISGNALTALPPSLSRLSMSLRVLRAADNRLTSPLPAVLGKLANLRVLNLENNTLSRFPGGVVGRLKELRSLKLAGNSFASRAPPKLSDILPYLEELTLPHDVVESAGKEHS